MNYSIKQFPDKVFTDKMDLTRFIKYKRQEIEAIKKSEYKRKAEVELKSDLFAYRFEPKINVKSDKIRVKAGINSTNVIDSHMDLHDMKMWNKNVADNKYSHHLKTHTTEFESIISSKALNYNELMNFKDLGLNVSRPTTMNINEFTLERSKNKTMFNAYANGDVMQHSVGMLYVDLEVAFYDEDSEKNMARFEALKSLAINPELADEMGHLWYVTEAKKREGSAVVFGSNSVTPTLWVKDYETWQGENPTNKNIEAVSDNTSKPEPSGNDTQSTFTQLLKQIKTN